MDTAAWMKKARLLAGLTIGYNLVEGLVSMAFGWSDGSLALFGFGVDSFIEVGSALLILWRLREGAGCRTESLARERRATLGIGVLFLLLAIGTTVGSLGQLYQHRHPSTGWPGLVVSSASLLFMAYLWRAKVATAQALDSKALASDAACSLVCIQLSGILLAGSLVCVIFPRLWWADGVAALGLSLFIAREGLAMVRAASDPHFEGGCGCD